VGGERIEHRRDASFPIRPGEPPRTAKCLFGSRDAVRRQRRFSRRGRRGGEAESRRKVDDGDDATRVRACACAARVSARDGGDRRKVGRRGTTSASARSVAAAGAPLRELQRARIGAHRTTVHAPPRGVGEDGARVLARACNWVAGSTTSAKAARAVVLDLCPRRRRFDLASQPLAGVAVALAATGTAILLLRGGRIFRSSFLLIAFDRRRLV